MIEHIPFLPNSEGDTDILGRSLNELSHLSRVLSFLVRETNQYKLQLDFLLLVNLVLQTAFDPDERLDTEEQLANRLRNRFKRYITDEFVQQVLYQMRSAGWVDKTKQDGIRITNAGIRMGTLPGNSRSNRSILPIRKVLKTFRKSPTIIRITS